MNLPMETLQGVYDKVGLTLETASGLGEIGAGTGMWHLVLTLPELRAMHMLLAQGLRPLGGDVNPAGGRVTDHPDYQRQPTRFMHTIVVKSAAAVPGVQALLFLYRAVSDVEVTAEAFLDQPPYYRLTWADDTPDVDLDFLRPHILPPKKT